MEKIYEHALVSELVKAKDRQIQELRDAHCSVCMEIEDLKTSLEKADMMNVYVLRVESHSEIPSYDVFTGHVVCAKSEEGARFHAARQAADEGAAVWLDENITTCQRVDCNTPLGIVLSAFNAG